MPELSDKKIRSLTLGEVHPLARRHAPAPGCRTMPNCMA